MRSWIQNHILNELTANGTLRYSELRPRDIEGNLFMYHLKGLVKDKLVEKTTDGYTLTEIGIHEARTRSLTLNKTREQPRILNVIICKNKADEYLFYRWDRQPNWGLVSFPHGMLHSGEQLHASAIREALEKIGETKDIEFIGMTYLLGDKDHVLVNIFRATVVSAHDSKLFWSNLDLVPRESFVPGFFELSEAITSNTTIPLEIMIHP